MCFLLHILDRQFELTSRTDFLFRNKLSTEEEGVDTMRGINKILLENILPAHVAEHYLLQVRGQPSTQSTAVSTCSSSIFKRSQYHSFILAFTETQNQFLHVVRKKTFHIYRSIIYTISFDNFPPMRIWYFAIKLPNHHQIQL